MSSPEVERPSEKPKSAFMKLDDFTPQMLRDIAFIYKDTVGGSLVGMWMEEGSQELRHAQTLETWSRHGSYAEYRLGSMLTLDSKLWLTKKIKSFEPAKYEVEVWFDGNLEREPSEKRKERELELKEQFAERVQGRIGYPRDEI